jgi:PKHD-type hydroxylase
MMLQVPGVLAPEQVTAMRARLDAAGDAWVDRRATAGHQGTHVKRNLQIA